MTRRFAIVIALAVVATAAAGCRDQRTEVKQPSTADTTTTSEEPVALPPAKPWVPSPNEIEVDLKQAAATTLTALLSYAADSGTVEAARSRLSSLPAEPGVADKILPLLRPAAQGAADVVYPQMGGFTGDQASVMAVTRLRILHAGAIESETRTIDVRLARRGGRWLVVDIASLGGDPAAAPAQLSASANAVLAHPGIELPDSARWDIATGRVSDDVLDTLRALADGQAVRVAVLSSGHPVEVFGTPHVSNHIPGRAVDVWAVGGVPVVEQRAADGPLRGVIDSLLARGVTELGSPFDVDGPRGANFANLVHQDHLHIGYDA